MRGTSTRHLKMTVDLTKATEQLTATMSGATAERLKAAVTQAATTVGVTSCPSRRGSTPTASRGVWSTRWTCPRPRSAGAEGTAATGTAKVTMEFYDFGKAIDVAIPSPEETVDLADLIGTEGVLAPGQLKRFMATSTPSDQDQLDGVGGLFEGDVDLLPLGLGEPPQHVVGALALTGRLADPDADPDEVLGVQVGHDRLQPVVAGQPAAVLHLEAGQLEVHLVVDHHQPAGSTR